MDLTRQTLCYVFRDGPSGREVLLGEKLSGFGKGMIMGLGGHVEDGESDADGAIREILEESGLVIEPSRLTRRATVTYLFPSKPALDARVAVFFGEEWSGVVTDSDEIRPEWFPAHDPPLGRMWDDERYWLPRVLAGGYLTAVFTFDESCTRVVEAEVREADPASLL